MRAQLLLRLRRYIAPYQQTVGILIDGWSQARNATQSKGKLGSQLENNKKTTLKQQMLNEAQQKKVQQEQLVWD